MRVLVVEDDRQISRQLVQALGTHGYVADTARNGEDGKFLGQTESYDAIILDLGLPVLDGISVLQSWRQAGMKTPVLVLTARDTWSEKVKGLRAGADDYLTKPFEYPELAARVKALLRRSLKAASDTLTVGPVAIDFGAQAVRLNGEPLELTAYEYRLLEYLVRERARVVTKSELADYLYPHGEDRDSNVVEVLIGRLRRKLDPEGTLAPVETVRGRGYRFALE